MILQPHYSLSGTRTRFSRLTPANELCKDALPSELPRPRHVSNFLKSRSSLHDLAPDRVWVPPENQLLEVK